MVSKRVEMVKKGSNFVSSILNAKLMQRALEHIFDLTM
jgi:hypothetical protein